MASTIPVPVTGTMAGSDSPHHRAPTYHHRSSSDPHTDTITALGLGTGAVGKRQQPSLFGLRGRGGGERRPSVRPAGRVELQLWLERRGVLAPEESSGEERSRRGGGDGRGSDAPGIRNPQSTAASAQVAPSSHHLLSCQAEAPSPSTSTRFGGRAHARTFETHSRAAALA